jgi:hypothetical protein
MAALDEAKAKLSELVSEVLDEKPPKPVSRSNHTAKQRLSKA